MKLMIVRHGDPDYARDSLTETGWKEARMLSEMLVKKPADYYYVSPLGRAKDTASCTMKKLGREAVELEWLQEFTGRVRKPNIPEEDSIAWDWLPQDWTKDARYFSDTAWRETEIMQAGNAVEKYDEVIRALDGLLARHGYVREGRYYRAVAANNDTLVFFCHYGLECVLLSHLLNVSPMVLWHGFCAAPTSVTTVITEERREGIAYFRTSRFGAVSHRYAHGAEPSFSARFVEKHGNEGERVD